MVCIILEGYTYTYLPLLTLTPEPSIDKIKPNPLQPLRPPPVFKYFVSIFSFNDHPLLSENNPSEVLA